MTFKLSGDTILDNISYKKVYLSEDEIPTNWEFYGGMREDENQKVWFYPTIGMIEEQLIYDFSVNVGDTIYFNYESVMVVDSIAYHEIAGIERKHIYFSYVYFSFIEELWIEGIGSNYGILSSGSGSYVGGWTWFLCMSENGQLIYMNPNYSSCYLISTGIQENDNSIIQVYPNPVQDKIKINYSENTIIESMSIIDLKGQKIIEFEINKTELDLSGISKGLYFLKVTYEKGEIIRKIIVE